MQNVIYFPSGTAAPEKRFAPEPGSEQQVFSPDQVATLTYEDGRLYGWASREARLPAHYWALEADLKNLMAEHGAVMAARRLALPVPFVRGWAVELELDAPSRVRPAREPGAAPDRAERAQPSVVSPLADDAFLWSGTPACA